MELRRRNNALDPGQTETSDRPKEQCLSESRHKTRQSQCLIWLMRLLTISAVVVAIVYVYGLVPRKTVPIRPVSADLAVQDQFNISILTPDLQSVKTSKLILGNGLKAFIVSDPGIVKAGAALSVETGAWRDPPGVSGLAHFTEHMLFMGSQAFPAESEYERYISTHAGILNAWTSGDHTLYYFNVLPHGLLGALDRLSQFFVAPLFSPSSLEREREAVNSEYNMGAMQDRRRLWFVEQDIMRSSNHPFSYFTCGNLTTLASLDQNSIRAWFNDEYDPRGMHLVVFGHEPLQLLEQRVKTRFGKIKFSAKWEGPVRAEVWGEIVPKNVTGSWVFVEPIKDIRTLDIMWEIPARFAARGTRIANVAASVLSRLGEGSILSKLKAERLVTAFSADVENEAADSAFFYVHAELTLHGLANYRRVVEIIFQGIGTLGRTTLPSYAVDEHNTMGTLNYQWQARRTDYGYYAERVYALRQEDLEFYPKKELFWEYAPFDISDIFLNHLTPNLGIVLVNAKSSDSFNVIFDRSEPVVGARYAFIKFSGAELSEFVIAHGTNANDIRFADKSPFIPSNLNVPQANSNLNRSRWEPKPEQVASGPVDIFMVKDDEFGVPKLQIRQTFFSPALNYGGIPRKQIVAALWLGQVQETLEQLRYSAGAGGYDFTIDIVSEPSPALTISVGGYSSRDAVAKLMQSIYNAIRFPTITASRLESDLDELRQHFYNQDYDELFRQTNFALRRWVFNSSIVNTAPSMVAAIDQYKNQQRWQSTAEDDIRGVIHQVFLDGQFYELLLLEGDIESADIDVIENTRTSASLSDPTLSYIPPQTNIFRPSFISATQPVIYHRYLPTIPAGRSAVRLIVGLGNSTDPDAVAFGAILDAVVSGQFFTALRTKQQLGYYVGSVRAVSHGMAYQAFIVQTEKFNGTETLGRIDAWIKSWIVAGLAQNDSYTEIDGDKEIVTSFADHFTRIKDGVVANWESKHPSLTAKTNEHEQLLYWHRDDLNIRDETLVALQKMTRDDFRSMISTYFGGMQNYRAIVLDGSAGSQNMVDVSRDGWIVVSDQDIDAEDSIS